MRLRSRISEEGTDITLIPSGQTREKSELPSWVSGASETGPALGFLKLGLKEVRRSGWPSSCRRYSQGKFDIFWGGMELSSNKISV